MKRKKISAAALALAVSLSCTLSALPAQATDTDTALQTVRAMGIMTDTTLGGNVTRAQLAKMLVAASSHKDSIGEDGSGYSLFKDVKSSHWASEYIRLALEEGWMTGFTDGTFRPEKTVTLEEACTALLRLLGYDTSALAGSFPYAQLNKASALGLRDNIGTKQGGVLSRQDCAHLFYNLMTAQTATGKVYGTTLGYTITGGEVDQTALALEELSGPFVAGTGTTLPFQPTTIYRNGERTTSATLNQYDVYYYNDRTAALWSYTDRVSGKITALSPSLSSPTSVTVAGKSYTIGSSTATYKLSALGGGRTEQIVTLLLGMDGTVVDVLSDTAVEAVYYGMVSRCSRSASETGSATVQTSVSVICTDGVERTFVLDEDKTYTVGKLVSVSISNSEITLKNLSGNRLSGSVNTAGTKLGSYAFAANVEILDTNSEGLAAHVSPTRLAGLSLSSDEIRFYALNTVGEIEYLILNDVTGDLWTYGYLTSLNDNSSSMSVNVSYTYLIDGKEQSLRSSGTQYSVSVGGIAIGYSEDGSIKTMKKLTSARLTKLATTWAMTANQKVTVSDTVQVYLSQNGKLYATTLSAINAEDYTLTGWYNSAGNRIELIVAVEK